MEIGLKEYRKLKKQADERKVDEIGLIFDDKPSYIPTENAKEAQKILDEAQLVITLEEREELVKVSNKKEVDKLSNLFYDDDKTRMVETQEAREAKKLIEKATIVLTPEERNELVEQSKEKEVNQVSLLSSEKPTYTPTLKALLATDILKKSRAVLSLQDRKEIMRLAEKQEPDELLGALGIKEMAYTKDAINAQDLLGMSELVITPEEKKELEKEADEKKVDEVALLFDEKPSYIPTEKAKDAQYLLKRASISITLDELNKYDYQSEFNGGKFFMCEEFTDKKMKKNLSPNDIEPDLTEAVRFSDIEEFNSELISHLKGIDDNTRKADEEQRGE